MIRCPLTTETHTVLRIILSAGALAVLLVLACAGRRWAQCWVVDDGGGADFCEHAGSSRSMKQVRK